MEECPTEDEMDSNGSLTETIDTEMRKNMSFSYDSVAIGGTSIDDIDTDALHRFRKEMRDHDPDHRWNVLSDKEFMRMTGAMDYYSDQLSVAGLLMFGKEPAIYVHLPNFKLDYREYRGKGTGWDYRLVTGDGTWNGNIYNFLSAVHTRLIEGMSEDVQKALTECLLNALIHADYLAKDIVKIGKYPEAIKMTNSGVFRIPLKDAILNRESTPRNETIARMFHLLGLVNRAGLGLTVIHNVWRQHFARDPVILEDVGRQRVTVELMTGEEEKTAVDELIIDMINFDSSVSAVTIAKELDVSVPTVKNHLKSLKDAGVIQRIGGTRGRWKLS